MCGHEHRRQNGLIDFAVVVRVDADLLPPQVERVRAVVHRLQLVVGLEIRETPEAAVDDVRKALLLRHLRKKWRKKVETMWQQLKNPNNGKQRFAEGKGGGGSFSPKGSGSILYQSLTKPTVA